MSLLPEWAPNAHPLVVHFPIALVVVAAVTDAVALVVRRRAYRVAAYVTGQEASESVMVEGGALRGGGVMVQRDRNYAKGFFQNRPPSRQKRAFLGIEESDVFLALVTAAYLRDAASLAQAEYVRILGKPFVLLVEDGFELPDGFCAGVDLLHLGRFSPTASAVEMERLATDTFARISARLNESEARADGHVRVTK